MPFTPRLLSRTRAFGSALLGGGLVAGLALSGTVTSAQAAVLAPDRAASAVAPSMAVQPLVPQERAAVRTTETDAPPEERAGQDPAVQLVVSPRQPLLQSTAEEYEFGVILRNTTEEAFTGGDVALRLAPQRIASIADLDDGTPVAGPIIASTHLGETRAESAQEITLTVPRSGFPLLPISSEGVYRLEASFIADDAADPGLEHAQDPGSTEASVLGVDSAARGSDDSTADSAAEQSTGESAEVSADAETGEAASSEAQQSNTAPETVVPEPSVAPGDTAGRALTSTTAIVWRGAGKRQLQLSVIVPFVLPSEAGSMPTRKMLEALAPDWERLLEQATLQQATLAIDPRVIAGIRAYGSAAPESARDFLAALEQSPLQSFLLQFGDADPAAQAALGFDELLQPTGLEYLTRYGDFPVDQNDAGANETDPDGTADASPAQGETTVPDSHATGAADATDNADAPADPGTGGADGEEIPQQPPTLAEMLSWPNGEAASWPAAGSVDADTLDLLRSSGLDTVVLSSDNVSLRGGPLAALDDGTALITDADLAADASDALRADTETERWAATADIAARSALTAQGDGTGAEITGRILALDRGGTAESADPAELLAQLRNLPWLSFVPASEQTRGTATLVPGSTAEARTELLLSAVNREESVDAMGGVLVDPEYLSGYQRARLLAFFGTRYAADDADFIATAEAFRERDAELLKGVEVVSTESTQLVGATTNLPLQVHNSLPFDALVDVQIDPASAAVSIKERTFSDVVVPAEGNEHVMVPVHARVSSGSSGIIVTLSSVSDDLIAFTGTIALSINTSIETIAVWVLGALALLLLVFGTWRSIRRRARRQDATAAEPSETSRETTPGSA